MGAVVDPQPKPVGRVKPVKPEPGVQHPRELVSGPSAEGAGPASRQVRIEGRHLRRGHFPVEVRVNQEAGFYAVHWARFNNGPAGAEIPALRTGSKPLWALDFGRPPRRGGRYAVFGRVRILVGSPPRM